MACSDNSWKRGGELLHESLKVSWRNKRLWIITLFPLGAFVFVFAFEELILKFLFGIPYGNNLGLLVLLFPMMTYGLILLTNFFYAMGIVEGSKQLYMASLKQAFRRIRHPFFLVFALFSIFEFVLPFFLLLGFLIIPLLIVVAYSDFSVKESLIDFGEVIHGSAGIIWSITFRMFGYLILLLISIVSLGYIFSAIASLNQYVELVMKAFLMPFIALAYLMGKLSIGFFFRSYLSAALITLVPAFIARDMLENSSK